MIRSIFWVKQPLTFLRKVLYRMTCREGGVRTTRCGGIYFLAREQVYPTCRFAGFL